MKQQGNKPTVQQQRNMQFTEDRIELLNTIRDMIGMELDRRGVTPNGNRHTEPPQSDQQVMNNTEYQSHGPGDNHSHTLWHRIATLFTL